MIHAFSAYQITVRIFYPEKQKQTGENTYGFTKIAQFILTGGLTCQQQHSAAYTASRGKGNSNNRLKILVPLWSEMVCWNRSSTQPHLNIAVAGMA